MRFLFVTNNLYGGGAERVISVISDQLIKDGEEVGIVISKRKKGEYFLNPQITVFDNNKRKKNRILQTFQEIKEIRKVLKKYRPDFVIPFLINPVRETFIASVGLPVKQVSTVRNNPKEMRKSRRIIQNYVLRNSNVIWLQTAAQKDYIPKTAHKKSFILPNPVDQSILNAFWERQEHDTIELIMTGRLHEQKNYPMLINAVSIVHEKYPNVRLRIFGQGPKQEELMALIEEKKASGYICLCGRTNNPLEELLKSDIFVFSSDYEGMPNALMEAMAIGLPCISTDCPTGPKELIGDNERGMLVPVNNTQEMANAIIGMIDNPIKAQKMGCEAKNYISKKYSPEIITQALIENLVKYR